MRRKLFVSLLVPVALSAAVEMGFAKCQTQTRREAVEAFTADPNALLSSFPNGGAELGDAVASLVVSGTDARLTLARVVMQANSRQTSAFAMGMASAYSSCLASNPEVARAVDLAAHQITDRTFQRMYALALLDHETVTPIDSAMEPGDLDERTANKLGFSALAAPEIRDPKKPIPLPGSAWFDK